MLYIGWAKSKVSYVGLYSSVTYCPIEVIHFHHSFAEYVKSMNIYVHFFRIEVHYRIYDLFDNSNTRIEPNFIELCLAIQIHVTNVTKYNEFVHYV